MVPHPRSRQALRTNVTSKFPRALHQAAILDKLWEAIGPVVDSKQPYWQRLSQPADPKLNSQQHVQAPCPTFQAPPFLIAHC